MNKKKSYSSRAFKAVTVDGVEYYIEAEATEWGDSSIGGYEFWGQKCTQPHMPYCEGFAILAVTDGDGDVLEEATTERVRRAIDDDPDLYSQVLTALDEAREEDDYEGD